MNFENTANCSSSSVMDANSMNREEEENQYFPSVLKIKTIELENKLLLEKRRYILLQSELESSMSIASKHLDLYKNECTSLRGKLSALENDYNLLKEKELKSQETIKNLLKKIERVDKEHGSESQKNCENLKKNDNQVNKEKDAHDNAMEKEAENTRIFVDLDSNSDMEHSTEPESHGSVKHNRNQTEKRIPKLSDRNLSLTKHNRNQTEKRIPKLSGRNPSLTVSDNELQTSRKRNRSFCRFREYNGRPADDEQRLDAMTRARKIQKNLTPRNPSFIRSMARSHVSGSFWLTLNPEFCHKHLGISTYNLILQDETGSEFEVRYLGHVTALSGGWAGFAKAHKLELYDAVLFELCEPTKFKVHIIKANQELFDDSQDKLAATESMEDQDIDLSDMSTYYNKMNEQIEHGGS